MHFAYKETIALKYDLSERELPLEFWADIVMVLST